MERCVREEHLTNCGEVSVPLLSVVIPVWNRRRLVCEAIDSALGQRAGDVEVIVVDDASTDGTAAAVGDRFGSRVRLLRMPRRSGPAAARNAGVRMATGTLLAFLDSDDVWLPGKLDAELRVLEQFEGAEAVITDDLSFLEGEAEATSRFAQNGLLAATEGSARWVSDCRWLWTNSWNGVATCSITMRRSAAARISPALFSEDLEAFEDWEFELRLYDRCRVVALPEVWSWVRRFDDGTRAGRAVPGKPLTREQKIRFQQYRLKVIERAEWQSDLHEELRNELERCRAEIVVDLAREALA
jgi:glycosyltransferase involved in cell wall biosynthesis